MTTFFSKKSTSNTFEIFTNEILNIFQFDLIRENFVLNIYIYILIISKVSFIRIQELYFQFSRK